MVVGKGKSRDGAGSAASLARESVAALLRSLRSPFREGPDSSAHVVRLEASGEAVEEWLAAEGRAVLAAIIPPCSSLSAAANATAVETAAEGEPEEAADADQAGKEEAAAGAAAVAAGGPAAAAAAAAAAAVAGLRLTGSRCGSVSGVNSEPDAELNEELNTEDRWVGVDVGGRGGRFQGCLSECCRCCHMPPALPTAPWRACLQQLSISSCKYYTPAAGCKTSSGLCRPSKGRTASTCR